MKALFLLMGLLPFCLFAEEALEVTVQRAPVAADKTKVPVVALFVRNAVADGADVEDLMPMLRAALSAELTKTGCRVTDTSVALPKDTPETSPRAICSLLNTDAMVVATLTEAWAAPVDAAETFFTPTAELTVTAADAKGNSIANCGGVFTVKGRAMTKEQKGLAKRNAFRPLLNALAKSAGGDFSKISSTVIENTPDALIAVKFSCDTPGTVLKVDGVAYGVLNTTEVTLQLPEGLHELEVSALDHETQKMTANLRAGQTYPFVMKLNATGIAKWRDEQMFNETIKRLHDAGLTDDHVRKVLAEGNAEMLKNSHIHWEPGNQTLVVTPSAPGIPVYEMKLQ